MTQTAQRTGVMRRWVSGVLAALITMLSLPTTARAENPTFVPTASATVFFGNAFLGYGYSVVTAADMNTDGHLDVIMTRVGSTSVDILHGNGDGTFQNPVSTFVGGHPVSVVAADFNSDGKPDFACTNGDLGTVTIYLSTTGGNFAAGGSMVTGTRPVRLVAEDMNEDGHLDLIVVDQIDSTVGLLTGNGMGGFGTLQTSFVEINDSLEAVTVDDLNDDGHLDLIVPCPLQDLVAVLLGTGNGNFLTANLYPVGDNPGFIAVSDFDGDGIKDVAANNRSGDSLSLLLGTGLGALAPFQEIPIGDNPRLVQSIDTAGTGERDLAVPIAGDNELSIVWGLGATTQGYETTIPLSYSPDVVITGDFNGDLLDDIVVVDRGEGAPHGKVELFLNQTVSPKFQRGDVDANGTRNIYDAVALLGVLFLGVPHSCADSADFTDDGDVALTDVLGLLNHLFQSAPAPAEPLVCGKDLNADLLPACTPTCN